MGTGEQIVMVGRDAMRTRFEVALAGPDAPRLSDIAQAALDEIELTEAALSLFRRDSLVSHVNRVALREAVVVDGDTMALLELCRRVWELSAGAFDPTVAGAMSALGLHDDAQIASGLDAHARFDAVDLDRESCSVRFRRAVALDLGGVAKGWALDAAARVVREAGVERALLHGGTSSVVAIGAPPDREGWEVALGRGSGQRVALRDSALGVSAHAGRSVGATTHVLDPRTGASASERCAMAAVIAPSAALADAWSTATLVVGARPPGMPPEFGCVLV